MGGKLTARFYLNITHPTQRNVNNFGFLVGAPNGSSVKF
jgi:hypothetical protein